MTAVDVRSADLAVSAVVFDAAIYPRSGWSQDTVDRYADALDAGDEFPPVVVEPDTHRLWDGVHRWQAHRKAGRDTIRAVYETCPDDVPPKLFAASFSVRHGDQIGRDDLKALAREIITAESATADAVASRLAVPRRTVADWTGDITADRTAKRHLKAVVLVALGWTQQATADHLGIGRETVRDVIGGNGELAKTANNEPLLRLAIAELVAEDAIPADTVRQHHLRWRVAMIPALLATAAIVGFVWLPAPNVPAPKPGERIVCIDLFTGAPPLCHTTTN